MARFAAGLAVIVLGALMLAESIVGVVTGTTLFLEGVNRGFEFVMGLVTLMVGASLIPSMKRPATA